MGLDEFIFLIAVAIEDERRQMRDQLLISRTSMADKNGFEKMMKELTDAK